MHSQTVQFPETMTSEVAQTLTTSRHKPRQLKRNGVEIAQIFKLESKEAKFTNCKFVPILRKKQLN